MTRSFVFSVLVVLFGYAAASALACNTASITGHAKCDTTGVTITWTALLGSSKDTPHWSAGILPGASQTGKGTGAYAVHTTTWKPAGFVGDVSESEYATNGEATGNAVYATVHLDGSCQKPPPPPPPVFRNPRARFDGPCGDPFYRAVFNNRHSNVSERFSFRYFSYATMSYQHIRARVRAGGRHTTRYVHVLGGSRLAVYAAHKGLIAHKQAAAPGNYGACA